MYGVCHSCSKSVSWPTFFSLLSSLYITMYSPLSFENILLYYLTTMDPRTLRKMFRQSQLLLIPKAMVLLFLQLRKNQVRIACSGMQPGWCAKIGAKTTNKNYHLPILYFLDVGFNLFYIGLTCCSFFPSPLYSHSGRCLNSQNRDHDHHPWHGAWKSLVHATACWWTWRAWQGGLTHANWGVDV